ncbi:MAG: DUF1579 domain-containing protein [Fimbriimonadaceae bacterium]|nr:DUF1579 domain-containing protein [Fimbriimonadaceae bacterium]QYK57092.1 MAG: DUF1579 domain-containing protein [Fimbriimonadaceae bacterium]
MSETTGKEEFMPAKPGAEHEWLGRMVGDWTFTSESQMPDGSTVIGKGTETVRSLHGMWFITEGKGGMAEGDDMAYISVLGYDQNKGAYVGSWSGSPTSHMFIYEGQRCQEGDCLPLKSTGPDFSDPSKTVEYIDRIDWIDEDTRTLTSLLPGPDGALIEFMKATYKRS